MSVVESRTHRKPLPLDARRAYEAQLIEKAWEDPEFRARLLTNPKAAMVELLGLDIPEHIEIGVLQESTTKLYIVLPLSPEELEQTELTEDDRRSLISAPTMCHISCHQWAGTC